jgi:hypothetical protein
MDFLTGREKGAFQRPFGRTLTPLDNCLIVLGTV